MNKQRQPDYLAWTIIWAVVLISGFLIADISTTRQILAIAMLIVGSAGVMNRAQLVYEKKILNKQEEGKDGHPKTNNRFLEQFFKQSDKRTGSSGRGGLNLFPHN